MSETSARSDDACADRATLLPVVVVERLGELSHRGSCAGTRGGSEFAHIHRELVVIAHAPASVWLDVTWTYRGEPRERFCYQLTDADGELRIAVLTSMATP